jgi:hypothetical protein
MTDREIAVATFKAVAALHYAMTGKPLSITVETETGSVTITDPMGALPAHCADLAESQTTPYPQRS